MFGKKAESGLLSDFTSLVGQGKFTQQHPRILRNIVKAKKDFKKKSFKLQEVDKIRKDASILINELIEYSQRSEFMALEKSRMRLKYMEKGKPAVAELLHTGDASFLFQENKVKKITNKIEASDMKEVSAHVEAQKKQGVKKGLEISPKIFEMVKKELGEFEIIL